MTLFFFFLICSCCGKWELLPCIFTYRIFFLKNIWYNALVVAVENLHFWHLDCTSLWIIQNTLELNSGDWKKKKRDNERKWHVMKIHTKCCQSESLTCLRSVVFIWQWIDTYTATSSRSFGRQPLFIWPLRASPAYGRGRGLWSQKLGCQRQHSPVGSPGAISVLSEGPDEEWFRNPCWREQERDDALPKRGLLGPHCGATPRDGRLNGERLVAGTWWISCGPTLLCTERAQEMMYKFGLPRVVLETFLHVKQITSRNMCTVYSSETMIKGQVWKRITYLEFFFFSPKESYHTCRKNFIFYFFIRNVHFTQAFPIFVYKMTKKVTGKVKQLWLCAFTIWRPITLTP